MKNNNEMTMEEAIAMYGWHDSHEAKKPSNRCYAPRIVGTERCFGFEAKETKLAPLTAEEKSRALKAAAERAVARAERAERAAAAAAAEKAAAEISAAMKAAAKWQAAMMKRKEAMKVK